ncbi:murein L,D-transpeptidase catalytic domain family protein [Flavobacterium sp. ANB]|uniref:murein L,D-transpeptidase catalytic domain-containing protein n=1 Tax=unclassified Flavobacterium TaxID=196869 RepID=UPI0012B7F591|nr:MULTISPECIES: murein L,D-transpeptidase catalytic domain family protein [unclassified Flavobacterium]MBF4518527.1 murein L,D-transpeptidase catalytic domain family protein [Flavobacterium sp. ANB]MTD67967.1 peptidase [Flavobacterium sp. LC2016-13]
MKNITFVIGLALILSFNKKEDKEKNVLKKEYKIENVSKTKDIDYSKYYKEAKQYCESHNLNKSTFILIDLGLHSGLKRFFVYDFKKNAVSKSCIVSHGCGDNRWGATATKEKPQISNEFDSHCSSLGKYVILNRGVSQWGIKVNYILEGKDKTNSNARNRAIVLHSWDAVPENEVYPEGTPEGWGCPAVSNESMKEIDELLKTNKKVLMWIIKS